MKKNKRNNYKTKKQSKKRKNIGKKTKRRIKRNKIKLRGGSNQEILDKIKLKRGSNNFNEPVLNGSEDWIPDIGVNNCLKCGTQFNFVKRRHHCRNCGGIFCNECSKNTHIFDNNESHRVCDTCFNNFKVTIRDMFSKTHVIDVERTTKVIDLKRKFGSIRNIPEDEIRLIYNSGRERVDLIDERTLESYGMVSQTELTFVLKLKLGLTPEPMLTSRVVGEKKMKDEPIYILILGRTLDENFENTQKGWEILTKLKTSLGILEIKKVIIHMLDKHNSKIKKLEKGNLECEQKVDTFSNFFDSDKEPKYDFILNDTKTIRFITGEYKSTPDSEILKPAIIRNRLKRGGKCLLQEIGEYFKNYNKFHGFLGGISFLKRVVHECFSGEPPTKKIKGNYPLLSIKDNPYGEDLKKYLPDYYYEWIF